MKTPSLCCYLTTKTVTKLNTVSQQHYALKKSSLSSTVQIKQSCINESKGGKFLSIVDSLIMSITIPYCDNLQRYCILFRDTGA